MKTSKFFLSTLIAAAAMTSTAYAATEATNITTNTTVQSFDSEYNLYEGAYLNCDAKWNLSGVTFNIVPQEETTKFAWIYSGITQAGKNINQTLDELTLKGSGDFGVAITTGAGSTTATVTLTGATASDFKGRLIVINKFARPVITSLSGDEFSNTEYMFGTVATNEPGADGKLGSEGDVAYGLGSGVVAETYTLNLTGNTKLAGITGSGNRSSQEAVTAAAGTTLTLTGGDSTYEGYSSYSDDIPAFVYNGAFGTSTTAIGLDVTGGNHTFGGTTYLGNLEVSGGVLNLNGATSLSIDKTISVADGATLNFGTSVGITLADDFSLSEVLGFKDVDETTSDSGNGYKYGTINVWEGSVTGTENASVYHNGAVQTLTDGSFEATDNSTYYVNTGTVNYSTISDNSALTSVQIADGATMVLDAGETSSTISAGFSGEGTVQKTGTGTTTISGTMAANGLDVQGGKLSIASLSANSLSITEGAILEVSSALAMNGKTLTVVGNNDTKDYAWVYAPFNPASSNTAIDFSGITLNGSGDLGVAGREGDGADTLYLSLSGVSDSSTFIGRISTLNFWNRPVNTSISGTGLKNAEYVFGSFFDYDEVDTQDEDPYSFTAGVATGLTTRYTLNISGDTSLAGLTSGKSSRDFVTAASGATLTLTGGDSEYEGYTNNGAFVYNGKFGASNAAINLTVSGANQTLGGETYIGALNITNGSLSVGGGTASITSATMSSGATLNIVGSQAVTLGAVNKDGDTERGDLILDSSSVNLVLTGEVYLNRMTVGTMKPKTVSIDFGTDGLIRTTFDSDYNGGGINFGDTVKNNSEGKITFTVSFDENLFEGGSDIIKRDLLVAENNGGNGIWNLSDAKALEVVVAVTGYTFGENSFVGLYTSEDALLEDLDVGEYGILLSQNNRGASFEGVSYATLVLSVPEPSAFGLLAGVGALALVAARRRRRK